MRRKRNKWQHHDKNIQVVPTFAFINQESPHHNYEKGEIVRIKSNEHSMYEVISLRGLPQFVQREVLTLC